MSEFYKVSILMHGELAQKKITANLISGSLEEALQSLTFLLATTYRQQTPYIYLVGGSALRTISQLPSYGLTTHDLTPILKDTGSVVADRVILEADEAKTSQLDKVLGWFKRRPSLTLDIYILSVSDSYVDIVNAWLESFKLGATFFENSAIPYIRPTTAAGQVIANAGDYNRPRGLNGFADISTLLSLSPDATSIRIDSREQIQVTSGGQSKFTSGLVLQDINYNVLPNTSNQVQSATIRRTVGLTLDIKAVASETNWFLNIDIRDSSINSGEESETAYTGSRIMNDTDGFALLASFAKKTKQVSHSKVPILATVPGLRQLLTKSTTNTLNQNIMILARTVHPLVLTSLPAVTTNRIALPTPDPRSNTKPNFEFKDFSALLK
jgi:hypothetical protein